jgi:membrane protein YqaA with SNARE-associated domain
MLASFVQAARRRPSGFLLAFRHFGAFGLFFLAILDSSPLPTLAGPDILTVILVVAGRNPWWEYALVATVGSVIGAFLTFRLARRAGRAYLEGKFGAHRIPSLLRLFERWGTGALVASTAIPFPFPTSVFFAAAGASPDYDTPKFLTVVAVARAVRYAGIALLADLYGRHIIRVLRHPLQYWGWLLAFGIAFVAMILAGIFANRRIQIPAEPSANPRRVAV